MDGQGRIGAVQGASFGCLEYTKHDANGAVQSSLLGLWWVFVVLWLPCSGMRPLGSLKPSYGHSMRAEGLVRSGGIFLMGSDGCKELSAWSVP